MLALKSSQPEVQPPPQPTPGPLKRVWPSQHQTATRDKISEFARTSPANPHASPSPQLRQSQPLPNAVNPTRIAEKTGPSPTPASLRTSQPLPNVLNRPRLTESSSTTSSSESQHPASLSSVRKNSPIDQNVKISEALKDQQTESAQGLQSRIRQVNALKHQNSRVSLGGSGGNLNFQGKIFDWFEGRKISDHLKDKTGYNSFLHFATPLGISFELNFIHEVCTSSYHVTDSEGELVTTYRRPFGRQYFRVEEDSNRFI